MILILLFFGLFVYSVSIQLYRFILNKKKEHKKTPDEYQRFLNELDSIIYS